MRFPRTKLAVALGYAMGGMVALLGVGTAAAQDQPAPQSKTKVEVTGSNIPRINAETALPVQVITRDDIKRTGVTTVEELLRVILLPQLQCSDTLQCLLVRSSRPAQRLTSRVTARNCEDHCT